tara:strand:+ start:363 stop:1073 length:711 start_codon:yes stop_codon:yes gene_type:complete
LFKNKNILVTGSTGDIGSKISYELFLKNANIHVTSRNEEELKNFEKKYNCKSNYIIADLKNNKDIKDLASKLPNLNGMVLNAGTLNYCPVKYINYEKMLDIFQINFFSNVLLIKELLTMKKIEKNCSIVIIGSISSMIGTPATSIYAASKAALLSFSKVLASELSAKKIRVNTVSPGIINTKMTKEINQFNELEKSYPLGLGDVEDVLNQVLFLLSDKSKWTTGSNFILDGGYFLK